MNKENVNKAFANKDEFLYNYRHAMRNQYGKELEEAGMIEKYVVLL